jgi:hypothetical protein
MSQVNTELGLAATTTISLNQANVRALAGVPSGAISMSNLYGKSNIPAPQFNNGNTLYAYAYEPSPSAYASIWLQQDGTITYNQTNINSN